MRVCRRFAREELAKRSELSCRANSDKPSCTCLVCAPSGFRLGGGSRVVHVVSCCVGVWKNYSSTPVGSEVLPRRFFRGSGMGMGE